MVNDIDLVAKDRINVMADKTGQCLCGAVTFEIRDVRSNFGACHCKMCQRWVGGAFRGVSVKTGNLSVTGDKSVSTFQSSEFAERANCNICGSALWYRLTAGKYIGNTSVAIGLLDDSDGLTLNHEYFVDYKNSTNVVPADRKQTTSAEIAEIIADFMGGDAK